MGAAVTKIDDLADTKLSEWLAQLASSAPAPGGGAVGALSASLGACLVEMVCALTVAKPDYADWREKHLLVMDKAERLRAVGLRVAEEDALAFNEVVAAYKLPRGNDKEKAVRSAVIQAALIAAAKPPIDTGVLAQQVLELGRSILDNSNKGVVSDIAVTAIMAKAALEASIVNLEINLAGIRDPDWQTNAAAELVRFQAAIADADDLIMSVRERINS